MNRKLGIVLFNLILLLALAPFSFAGKATITSTIARVPIPVRITVANENWNTTFSICNTTDKAIALRDIELDFNYLGKVTGNIWGIPWAAWHVGSSGCGQVQLLGGTQWTPPLLPDPNCQNPMTLVFAASPDTPLPTGPFVFKSDDASTSGAGKINVTMQASPAAGVGNPEVTVSGMGITQKQVVTWGNQWLVSNLIPGSYTVTSTAVDNGTDFFQAAPVNATVNDQATTPVSVVYTRVQSPRGKLTITMQASPGTGVGNPEVTVTGMGSTQKQVVNWGAKWEVTNLVPGSYTITAAKVDNGTDFFEADPINATVNAQANTDVSVVYKRIPTAQGNLNVTMQASPAAGLGNPTVTVTGMGTTKQQVVNWGTQWLLTNLATGSYTVSSSNVSNGTDTYQAAPVNANVTAGGTAQASIVYTRVQPGRPASWNNIKHVVIIILENEKAADSLRQPFMNSLTTKGAYTSQLFALTHPSQPNYIGLVAGSLLGVDDNDDVNLNARHVGDLLDAKGLTWKAYAEDLPSTPCFKGDSGKYDRKHEPFISFTSVQNNPAQCSKIVNGTQFFTDLAADKLPTFSFYVPNEDNNGHDTDVAFADRWLARVWGPVFNNTQVMAKTLFIVTYDEDDGGANNNIYTAFVGAAVKPGAASAKRYTLYSILRTVEEILQLGTLGQNDQTAAVINDVWQP